MGLTAWAGAPFGIPAECRAALSVSECCAGLPKSTTRNTWRAGLCQGTTTRLVSWSARRDQAVLGDKVGVSFGVASSEQQRAMPPASPRGTVNINPPKTWPAGSPRRTAQTTGAGRDHNVGLLGPSCQVLVALATPLGTAPHPDHQHSHWPPT